MTYQPPPQFERSITQPQTTPQAVGAQRYYLTAMPLTALNEGAAPVDCPVCGQRALTKAEYTSGNTTQCDTRLFLLASHGDVDMRGSQCVGASALPPHPPAVYSVFYKLDEGCQTHLWQLRCASRDVEAGRAYAGVPACVRGW
jgi:hypothetical protein